MQTGGDVSQFLAGAGSPGKQQSAAKKKAPRNSSPSKQFQYNDTGFQEAD